MEAARHPVFMVALAAIGWSLGGLLIKSVDWNSMAIAGVRSLIAAATVLLLAPRPRFTFSKVQVAAAVCYCLTVVFFVSATRATTAANAIFLQYTAPIYIALLSAWLLNEHPTRLDWFLIALALGGIALFFLDQLSFEGMWGNILALISGLSYATLAVLLRYQKDASPMESVLLGNLLTAVVGIPFCFTSSPGEGAWSGLVLLGVLQLGIPYVLYATAIRHVRALEACLIGTIEPVLNPILVAIFLGEKPSPWALVGGFIVLGVATTRGVATAMAARSRERR